VTAILAVTGLVALVVVINLNYRFLGRLTPRLAPRARGAAVLLVLLVFIATAGFVGGFVYSHNPQPNKVLLRISTANNRPAEEFITGTITRIGSGSFSLSSEESTRSVDFDGATLIDELLQADPAMLNVGAVVNLGGNLAGEGPVLTGVVSFGPHEETQQ
jgi:hypothetical protein